MAELWQAYGSWVLYGLFFLAFLWLHGLMHGRRGHGGHGGTRGGVGRDRAPDSHATHSDPPAALSADVAPAADRGDPAPHDDHAPRQKSRQHSGGCC